MPGTLTKGDFAVAGFRVLRALRVLGFRVLRV